MKIISFTDANKNFKTVLDTVNNGTDAVVINRQKDNDAVVMSSAHYNGLMETLYLLKSSANAAHLAKSVEQYKAGKMSLGLQ
ncbi:type II toxin-antitoxin system prevent-host-death family antitoxin [uncultured Psychrobacter sp.]|uniref:type II toxin-antitoxin system Phd/YefM family antitoxin n=1 Tax=uncultured Psychrobacter sp. TaxID=259303 RepID=UPI00259547AF|nr:type II toxin-antitoxin system prevent-host-death family antitoxin [uncultured Psychrobacter sp.]